MTLTRSFCPLCDWHHDQDDTVEVPPAITVDAEILASGDLVAIASAVAHQTLLARLGDAEDAIRAHLETHELIEWVQAVTTAQRQLADEKARQEAYEETIVGDLNERNTRDARRADKAETTLATIREYLETSDDEGIRTREQLLGMLDQAGVPSVVAEELAEADRYTAMVNAPLRPETIAAIAKRIKARDLPVRKVKPRETP